MLGKPAQTSVEDEEFWSSFCDGSNEIGDTAQGKTEHQLPSGETSGIYDDLSHDIYDDLGHKDFFGDAYRCMESEECSSTVFDQGRRASSLDNGCATVSCGERMQQHASLYSDCMQKGGLETSERPTQSGRKRLIDDILSVEYPGPRHRENLARKVIAMEDVTNKPLQSTGPVSHLKDVSHWAESKPRTLQVKGRTFNECEQSQPPLHKFSSCWKDKKEAFKMWPCPMLSQDRSPGRGQLPNAMAGEAQSMSEPLAMHGTKGNTSAVKPRAAPSFFTAGAVDM